MAKRNRNEFRVVMRGSGDGKTLEQALWEMAPFIRELASKAWQEYEPTSNDKCAQGKPSSEGMSNH